MAIHFLHIGKAGGTTIKAALKPFKNSHDIRLHRHDFTFDDMIPGDRALFSVREPISRYVSGFNSRLRKGQPRLFREWSDKEAAAFNRFDTPNALAEALSSEDPATLEAARAAMHGIRHVRAPLAKWVISREELARREKEVILIMEQKEIEKDFEVLKQLLKLPASAALPTDEVVTHRTPGSGFSSALSDLGRENLTKWYAKDTDLYHACLEMRARKLQEAGGAAAA